ncbi:hypothetical protein [Paraglaciecola arctica]|uniref:hypothetical protein n=1 Tax=Paraglaciecola arctica TaxID=1128911 RepID=UPI001C07447C|nr:hypothetical protein [Paraglaciecola arctica]MBU3002765.1 hypothetical protein [Paraglaciecola arctica]
MSDKHRRGSTTNEFCSVAATGKCGCGNDYFKACEGEATGWGNYPQKYSVRNASTKLIESLRKNQRSFEAHHALPVACISKVILAWDEKANSSPSVISGTKWCINTEKNMIAMPMWGHTIMWYTDNFSAVSDEVIEEILSKNEGSIGNKALSKLSAEARKSLSNMLTDAGDTAPAFKDLPQHNYSHTGRSAKSGYNQEVIGALKNVVANVTAAKDKHETDKIDAIKDKLDKLSETMKKKLKKRAVSRKYSSTHEAWKGGMKGAEDDPNSNHWYLNFSMAERPTKMTFPLGKASGSMASKISGLARSMWMPIE